MLFCFSFLWDTYRRKLSRSFCGISTAVDSPRSVLVSKWVPSHERLTCLMITSFALSWNSCSVGMAPRCGRLTIKSDVALLVGRQTECMWDCRAPEVKLKRVNFLSNSLSKIDIV